MSLVGTFCTFDPSISRRETPPSCKDTGSTAASWQSSTVCGISSAPLSTGFLTGVLSAIFLKNSAADGTSGMLQPALSIVSEQIRRESSSDDVLLSHSVTTFFSFVTANLELTATCVLEFSTMSEHCDSMVALL